MIIQMFKPADPINIGRRVKSNLTMREGIVVGIDKKQLNEYLVKIDETGKIGRWTINGTSRVFITTKVKLRRKAKW